MNKYQVGMRGQQMAEFFLQRKGYRILAQNYRTTYGEIDLIALHDAYIVFIEVKYRRGLAHGHPSESVTSTKKQRIIKTALHYISEHELSNQDFRFDVVEVLSHGTEAEINHIKNAFDGV